MNPQDRTSQAGANGVDTEHTEASTDRQITLRLADMLRENNAWLCKELSDERAAAIMFKERFLERVLPVLLSFLNGVRVGREEGGLVETLRALVRGLTSQQLTAIMELLSAEQKELVACVLSFLDAHPTGRASSDKPSSGTAQR